MSEPSLGKAVETLTWMMISAKGSIVGGRKALDADVLKLGASATEESPGLVGARISTDRKTILSKMVPWAMKGGLAILDQGLISGSNFIIGILLARWLLPASYGAYALAFGVFLLLTMLYGSLLLEPMGVFGGSTYRDCLRGYLRSLLWIHLATTVLIIAALGLVVAAARVLRLPDGLPGALAGVTVAAPCILLFWLARRSFYLELSPARAAIGSALYCTLVLGGLFLAHWRGILSPFAAFLLMGLGALVTGAYLLARLRAEVSSSPQRPNSREAWRKHWGYGRWALAGNVASWVPAYIFYPLLGTFSGMARAGELRALMNFVLPLAQAQTALSMLLVPYAARTYAQEGRQGARALTVKITLLSVGAAAAYWGLVVPLRNPLLHFLYSDKYTAVAYLVPLVAVGSVFWTAAYGSSVALRAMESPDSIFWAFCGATVVSLIVGIPATWAFGLPGAVWGINLSDASSFLMVAYLLRRKVRGG